MNTTNTTQPNFRRVPAAAQDRAQEHWQAGRYSSALVLVDPADRARYLMDNAQALLAVGAYEEALFLTYCHGARQASGVWKHFVSLADRDKLRACGCPVPAVPVRVFRGVESSTINILRRGVSWTTCPHTAAWFATRGDAKRPAVYAATVKPELVIFTREDRREAEIVVAAWSLPKIEALKELPAPIRPGVRRKEAGL